MAIFFFTSNIFILEIFLYKLSSCIFRQQGVAAILRKCKMFFFSVQLWGKTPSFYTLSNHLFFVTGGSFEYFAVIGQLLKWTYSTNASCERHLNISLWLVHGGQSTHDTTVRTGYVPNHTLSFWVEAASLLKIKIFKNISACFWSRSVCNFRCNTQLS